MAAAPSGGVQATVAKLPQKEANRARAEWPFEVGLIPLRDMVVDDTYQRPPHTEFIARTVQGFDPTLVGCIDVSRRTDGTFAILDGQQRYFAMFQIGKTACYAAIYSGFSIADEAGFFLRKNKDRQGMKPFYTFRARIVAGDEEAQLLQAAVEEQGFTLGPTTNERDVIGAIRAVEFAWGFASEHREESLTPTLQTIREAFFDRKGSLDANIIQGLARFWQTYRDEEVQYKVLCEALGDVGPVSIVGRARDAGLGTPRSASGGLSMPWLVARVCAELHNRKFPRADKKARLDTRVLGK